MIKETGSVGELAECSNAANGLRLVLCSPKKLPQNISCDCPEPYIEIVPRVPESKRVKFPRHHPENFLGDVGNVSCL